jgi:hypothetical protein
MSANFYGAIYGWSVCMLATMAISLFTQRKPVAELQGVTYRTQTGSKRRVPVGSWIFAAILIGLCILLNYLFR